MRILILSQYYDPEPVPKPAELAEALTERGHEVAVVTGFPNYPAGKLYDGFRLGTIKRGEINGIPVTRTFEYPYHGKRVLGRLLNYFSFMISAPLGSLFAPSCDAIYVWHPPLTIGIAAWLTARIRRVPFVYDVQDIWPESAVLSGLLKEGWLVKVLSRLERFVYRRADYLLVVTEGSRKNLVGKGVAPSKIAVMPHWVDESLFMRNSKEAQAALREQYGWKDRFVILFAGNIGLVQGLEAVVRAASHLRNEKEILLALVGDGTDRQRLQELTRQLELENKIQFIERQPMEKMPDFMAASDALLVHLKHSELSNYVIPTKTIAYLAAGKPILMAMNGAAADLIKDAEAGMVIPPEDPAALAAAIQALWNMPAAERAAMGQRGHEYLLKNLSKQKVIGQYEEILEFVARRKQISHREVA